MIKCTILVYTGNTPPTTINTLRWFQCLALKTLVRAHKVTQPFNAQIHLKGICRKPVFVSELLDMTI